MLEQPAGDQARDLTAAFDCCLLLNPGLRMCRMWRWMFSSASWGTSASSSSSKSVSPVAVYARGPAHSDSLQGPHVLMD